ncbi:C10 family peptidase [Paramuribaculum intestinale]|uniref:C10 family peptidase n=2 Tax=Paramuribaculum intestinale TaxID=2094151 RepID=UPI00272AA10E|nr:C10 family peptidase [Paramuribaculum intestinale]
MAVPSFNALTLGFRPTLLTLKSVLMIKRIGLFLLLPIFAAGCNQSEPGLVSDDRKNCEPTYVNVIDTVSVIDAVRAQSVASAFARIHGASRSLTEKTVESVTPIKGSDGSTALYAVDYADNGGYIIVSATKALQPVLAHIETGSFMEANAEKSGVGLWLRNACSASEMLRDDTAAIRQNAYDWMRYTLAVEPMSSSRATVISADLQMAIDEELSRWAAKGYYQRYTVKDWLAQAVHRPTTGLETQMNNLTWTSSLSGGPVNEISYILVKDKTVYTTNIQPLIKTMWGQWYPYNEQITNRYAVGCVAVALGQILKYHADLPGFDFSRMPLYSTESVPELARFLRYIGDKVEMDYGYSSSSNIYYAQAALSDMGYAYTFNSSHNINEITKSLKNRRPVYMRGANIADNVGHAWVCEGLTEASTDIGYALIVPTGQLGDASGPFTTMGERGSSSMMQKFYYNWGWDGNSNGFYVDPINWPSQVYFGDQMMSLTNIRKK